MDPNFTIRQMTLEDLKLVIGWANEEGWIFGETDIEALFYADPNGYFIGLADEVPVASFAAIKTENYCFWTLFIVREGYRDKGYGSKIFAHARNYCKDSQVMGLDATGRHISNYKRYGFKESCQTMSYSKTASGNMNPDLKELKSLPMEEVFAYDKEVFGYDRKVVLEALLKPRDNCALAKVRDGKIVGYGIMRKMGDEYLIGPLHADDVDAAQELFEGLQSYVVGKEVYTEAYDSNEDMLELAEKQGWKLLHTFTRMYARGEPKMDKKKNYAPLTEVC